VAKSDVSEQTRADAERAADVPKVEREGYEETVAAQEAESVSPPAPEGAEERAQDLAEASAPEEEKSVKVKYTGDGAKLTVGHYETVDFTSRTTADVSPAHAAALEQDFSEVERA
jgi:hypothetical protein